MRAALQWKMVHYLQDCRELLESGLVKRKLLHCGRDVTLPANVKLYGYNIHIGNDVIIEEQNLFMCIDAPISQGSKIMLELRVPTFAGNHRIDVIEKYMFDVGAGENSRIMTNSLFRGEIIGME